MQTSSSTSSSDAGPSGLIRSGFIRRLALFTAPYAVAAAALVGLGASTGEFLPASTAAGLQNAGGPVLYLPKLTDHSFAYKLAATNIRRPEIMALGASRSNQWRSAMFGGDFYNSSQAVYTFKNYTRFLEALGDAAPRVIIASVDFYNFSDPWNELSTGRAQTSDLDVFDIRQLPLLGLLGDVATHPFSVINDHRDPLYGVPAIGISAQRLGAGFRVDGSYQYGPQITGDFANTVNLEAALDWIDKGITPFDYGDVMSEAAFADLARFLDLAKSRGIKVIGVTMPLHPQVVTALDASAGHGIWRDFRGPRLGEWLEQRSVPYFDFSEIASFSGKESEFVDPYHPSEPAYLRILLQMAGDNEVASLLRLDPERIRPWLDDASDLEVFRNTFSLTE